MKNDVVVLKRKTSLYLIWCNITMQDDKDGLLMSTYYPSIYKAHMETLTPSPLMQDLNRFFIDNVDRLQPKSLAQRYWLATVTIDKKIGYLDINTFHGTFNVGVVYPELLKPYGVFEYEELINSEKLVDGLLYQGIDCPFYLPGYSKFFVFNRTVSSLVLDNPNADEMPDTYFWYYMKKRVLGL